MRKFILCLCFMAIIIMPGYAKENVGKAYSPCKGWVYFSQEEVDWTYSDGLKINGEFYYDWQVVHLKKIVPSKIDNYSQMVEDITKALIETNRLELNCRQ